MTDKNYVIGVDFGTDSVRSVIIDSRSGDVISSGVSYYSRWADGKYCNPSINQFRQHPLDYLEGLEQSIVDALASAPSGSQKRIAAISVDTTGSTPVAVDSEGTALSLREDFAENPNGMFILWKDHTSVQEASEINRLSREWGGVDFTKFSGGIYSSEWFWAKILHTLRVDEQVRDQAYSWVEHCDWIPAILTGNTAPDQIKRSRCAAGHKAMWHQSWGGLPDEAFLALLDPLLQGLRARLFKDTFTSDKIAGYLTEEWAMKTGLPAGIPVGVGALDAHMGAVGGQIKPYSFVKVIGTSTCDMLTAFAEDIGETCVKGICGQVDGSIIPHMIGLEAGQSAYGDIYAWFKSVLLWPAKIIQQSDILSEDVKEKLLKELSENLIPELSLAASKIPVGVSDIIALDWLNGRRTPDANQALKGAIAGLSLGSDAPRIFKALVEATAFGAKAIVDRFVEEGVPIKEIIAIGGVAQKSPFAMQTLADVLNMDIKISSSSQTVALGAAMFAAVIAGLCDNIEAAQERMGSGFEKVYHPNVENHTVYEDLYKDFMKLGNFIELHLTKS